jgi:hypothetical protein
MRRPQLSYANVMSTIAVFIALGGTSYAVARNSVGSLQLRKNAVTSAKVKDRSLRTNDLAPSARVGSRGPRGPAGPQGAPGGRTLPETWKNLSLAAGWANYGAEYDGAAYRREDGRVHLRGLVTRTDGLPPAKSAIGTLPSGFRPAKRMIFAVNGGPQVTRVDVAANGQVIWVSGTISEKDFTSLDTISFAPA